MKSSTRVFVLFFQFLASSSLCPGGQLFKSKFQHNLVSSLRYTLVLGKIFSTGDSEIFASPD